MSLDELDQLQLDRGTKYQLLYTEKANVIPEGATDFRRAHEEFMQLRQALNVVGVETDVQQELFDVVGALVHLGEVQFGSVAGAEEQLAAQAQSSAEELATAQTAQTALVELLQHDELA